MDAFKVVSFRGREFRIVRGTTHPQYSYDSFEIEEVDIREKYWNVESGEVVVDVGASYGSYTLTACAMGAKVFAFEPEPTVFKDLLANVKLNGWEPGGESPRCAPFNFGLWDSEDKVDMRSYAPHWPAQTISGPYDVEPLDSFLHNLSPDEGWAFRKLDWIKVDVEGAEEHVLKGARVTIERFHPRLLVECHTFLDPQMVEKVKELLPGNYSFELIDRPPCITVFARPI